MALLEYGIPGYATIAMFISWIVCVFCMAWTQIFNPVSIHRKLDLRNCRQDQFMVASVVCFVLMWVARSFC
ncbi:hypothetical protein VPHD479_0106 [Vibrio phage D479]